MNCPRIYYMRSKINKTVTSKYVNITMIHQNKITKKIDRDKNCP